MSETGTGKEYTPTTDEVRENYVDATAHGYKDVSEAQDMFNRWLAAHDREIKAEAWDEGFNTSEQILKELYDPVTPDEDRTQPDNPYRQMTP